MIKVTKLDSLTKELDELGRVAASLDGEITQIKFDPSDPSSVNQAIKDMESAIDAKVGHYSANSIASKLIIEMKAKYAQHIKSKQTA